MSQPNEETHREDNKPLRFQVILSHDSVKRLDQLREDMDLSSRADVLRISLRLLEAIMDEQANGNEVWIKAPDGTSHPYKILY